MDMPIVKMDDMVNDVELEQRLQPPDLNNDPAQHPVQQEPAAQDKQQNKLKGHDQVMRGEGGDVVPHMVGLGENREDQLGDENMAAEYTTDQLQFFMGLSLITGFVFMMVIDQWSGGHSHTHIPGERYLRICAFNLYFLYIFILEMHWAHKLEFALETV